jgi:hypothetical protein
MLAQALQSVSWTTLRDHVYCLVHTRIDSRSHNAFRAGDDRIDCEECGASRRSDELIESFKQFEHDPVLWLTLVEPTKKARHAVTKQIGEKDGSGWYIPIQTAFALVSNIPIRSRAGISYSIQIPETERVEAFTRLLETWRPETGRMTRPGHRQESGRGRRKRKPRIALGTSNTRYEQYIGEASIRHISHGNSIDVFTQWFDQKHQEALARSNWKPPGSDIDRELPIEEPDPTAESEEDTG